MVIQGYSPNFPKNKYKRCLLSVVCKDINDGLFMSAYAVDDAKNENNWEWFCVKFKRLLDGSSGITPKRKKSSKF